MHFMSYNSLEEMLDAMHEADAAASLAITPEQDRDFKPGPWGYAIHISEEGGDVIVVWGKEDGLEECAHCGGPVREGNCPADEDIPSHPFTPLVQNPNYVFGRWASEYCPEGELGSQHICTLEKISEEEYEIGRAFGWDPYAARGPLLRYLESQQNHMRNGRRA